MSKNEQKYEIVKYKRDSKKQSNFFIAEKFSAKFK